MDEQVNFDSGRGGFGGRGGRGGRGTGGRVNFVFLKVFENSRNQSFIFSWIESCCNCFSKELILKNEF